MKTGIFFWIMMAAAVPAYAGHGTIVETDTAFIVDYTGDASDKAAEKSADKAAPSAGRERYAAVQPAITAAPPVAAVAAEKPVASEKPRQVAADRPRQRQKRTGPWRRPTGMVDSPTYGYGDD